MALPTIRQATSLNPPSVPQQAQTISMTSIDHDLKSMALGIQAWFDGTSEFTDPHKTRSRADKKSATPAKHPARRK
jgi:hypothetical protein